MKSAGDCLCLLMAFLRVAQALHHVLQPVVGATSSPIGRAAFVDAVDGRNLDAVSVSSAGQALPPTRRTRAVADADADAGGRSFFAEEGQPTHISNAAHMC
jgi:hypothetical protein